MRWASVACALFVLAFVPAVVGAQTPTHKPGGFHSPDLPTGASWTHFFGEVGVFYYHCHPHPFMQGIIEVKEGPYTRGSTSVAIQGHKFVPDRLTIAPGTNVTWKNEDPVVHTVDESVPPATTSAAGGSPGPGAGILVAALAVAGGLARERTKRLK